MNESHNQSAFGYSIPQLSKGHAPGLTKREYAAIMLRVPDSGDEMIDAMIRRAHGMTEVR